MFSWILKRIEKMSTMKTLNSMTEGLGYKRLVDYLWYALSVLQIQGWPVLSEVSTVPQSIRNIRKDYDLLLPLYVAVAVSPICLLDKRQATHTASQKLSLKELANVCATCYYKDMSTQNDNNIVCCIALSTTGQVSFTSWAQAIQSNSGHGSERKGRIS